MIINFTKEEIQLNSKCMGKKETLFQFTFCGCDKHQDQSQPGVDSSVWYIQVTVLLNDIGAETMRNAAYWLSPVQAQSASLYNPGQPAQECHYQLWAGSSHINNHQDTSHRQIWSRQFFNWSVLFPGDSRLFQDNNKTNQKFQGK